MIKFKHESKKDVLVCQQHALTSVGMVQNHQLSVCFSDLIFIGGRAERQKNPQRLFKRHAQLNQHNPWKDQRKDARGSLHTWHLKPGQPLFLSFLVRTLLYNTLLRKPAAEHASKRSGQCCTERSDTRSSVFKCRTVLGKLWRACFTWGSICFMACMTYRPGRREDSVSLL